MNRITTESIKTKNIFLYLIFYLGIAQIFDFFIPIKIFGLSIFITIIPYYITIYIFIKSHRDFNIYKLYTFYIILIIFFITILLRSFFYNEQFFFLLATQRYFLFIPIFILITEKLINLNYNKKKIHSILYIIFFIHTFNSLLYIVGLPAIENVDKLNEDYIEFSRFAGILGGANVQASFISLVYSIIIFSEGNMNVNKFIFITFFAIIGIAPTVSRGSLLILFLVIIYFMYNYFITNIKFYKLFLLILIILLLTKIISQISNSDYNIFFNSFFDRFDTNGFDTGRSDKNIYFYNTISSDWLYYIFGIPIKLQFFGLQEFDSISDNSFTLLFSNLGIVSGLFFLFAIIFFSFREKIFKSFKIIFYLLLLFIIIYNNNAIIWTAWTAYAILGLFYLRNIQILQIID